MVAPDAAGQFLDMKELADLGVFDAVTIQDDLEIFTGVSREQCRCAPEFPQGVEEDELCPPGIQVACLASQ